MKGSGYRSVEGCEDYSGAWWWGGGVRDETRDSCFITCDKDHVRSCVPASFWPHQIPFVCSDLIKL